MARTQQVLRSQLPRIRACKQILRFCGMERRPIRNISTFGADQIDPHGENAEQHNQAFFLYLYLTVNVGCVIAFGFLANVATSGLPPLVPKQNGFFCAYLITALLMAMALLLGGSSMCFVGRHIRPKTRTFLRIEANNTDPKVVSRAVGYR